MRTYFEFLFEYYIFRETYAYNHVIFMHTHTHKHTYSYVITWHMFSILIILYECVYEEEKIIFIFIIKNI